MSRNTFESILQIDKSDSRILKFSFKRYNKSIVWFPVKEVMAVGNE